MPTLTHVSPIFAVKDLAFAIEHYQTVLGFEIFMQTTDPMPYAILNRGAISVHLMVDPEKAGKGGLYAVTDDVDSLYEELKGKGANVPYPPDDRPYGMRDMYASDCCGNTLGFGRPL